MNAIRHILQMPLARRIVTGFGAWFARAAGRYATVLLAVGAIALIWFGVHQNIAGERRQVEMAARQNAQNLTRAFEEQIIRAFRAVDQTLLYLRDSYARDPARFDIAQWSYNNQQVTDFAFQVALADKRGRLISSNLDPASRGLDLSDREHINVHMHGTTDDMFISKPVLGRVSNRWTINVTRRISAHDGSLAGVAIISVDPDYLTRSYRMIDVGPMGAVTLSDIDGIVLARASDDGSTVGMSIANGQLFRNLAAFDEGVFNAVSDLDGVARLTSYRKVKGLPLVLAVSLAHADMYAAFYVHARNGLILAIVLSATLFGVASMVMRYQDGLRRALTDAETASRARSEFVAMISHEIRTPMNGVIGLTGLLVDSRLRADQQRLVVTLRESAEHLLQIINDVLDFTKLEAGRIEFENIAFDLRNFVDGTVQMFAPRAHAKGIEIAAVVDPALPGGLVGDSGRLRQVLFNLLSNAIKFTQAGGITVEAELLPARSAGHCQLSFVVRDTGIGIPPDAIGLLFRKFSQIDSSISRRFGGTGLGLAICKALAEQMGGTISVESELGRGSAFRVTVDLPVAPSYSAVPQATALAGRHILVVDASPVGRDAIGRQLALLGARVETVDGCAAAIDHLRAQPVDERAYDCVLVSDSALSPGFVAAARAIPVATTARFLLLESAIAVHGRRPICEEFSATLMRPAGCEALSACILGAPAAVEHESPGQAGPGPFAQLRPIRILLAEDNQTNQLVASKMLAALGLRADVVANGLEAVDAVRSAPYDLIFMDVMMPELDGLAATRAIRNLPPPANGAHIIALTANATREDRDKCLAAGMNDFMPKPFKRDRMQQAIEWYLGLQGASAIETVPATNDEDHLLEQEMFRTLSDEIGHQGAAQILDVFLASNSQRLDIMRRSVETGDRDTVEREAHSMKSAAATFGFRRLSDLARDLERDADSLGHDELVRRLGGLVAAFGEAEKSARRTISVA